MKLFYLITSQQVLSGHEFYLSQVLGFFGHDSISFADLRVDVSAPLEFPESLSGIEVLECSEYRTYNQTEEHFQIYSLPYLEKYSISDLLDSPSKKIYFGYAPLWSYDPRLHFQLDFYKAMDFIFTTSVNADLGYSSSGISHNSIIKVVDPNITQLMSRKKCGQNFLWTPHWTQTWYGYPKGYSSFIWSVHEVLAKATNDPHKTFILRPHPFLNDVILDMKMRGLLPESPFALAVAAWDKLNLLPNVEESKSSLVHDICKSDVILTDPSTVMIYMNFSESVSYTCYAAETPPLSSLGEIALESSPHFGDAKSLRSRLMHMESPNSTKTFNEYTQNKAKLTGMLTAGRSDFHCALDRLQ